MSNLVPEKNTKEGMPLPVTLPRFGLEEFMWQEHWARSSPAEKGSVSTSPKACPSGVRTDNGSSADLKCIPMNKNVMFIFLP